MEPMPQEIRSAFGKDAWSLALEALCNSPVLAESRAEIEAKYGFDIETSERIYFLSIGEFKKFKADVIASVKRSLHSINNDIYDKICRELHYCENRDMPLARLVSYLIAILDVVYSSGAVALAVLIVKSEYLDKVCNCPKS